MNELLLVWECHEWLAHYIWVPLKCDYRYEIHAQYSWLLFSQFHSHTRRFRFVLIGMIAVSTRFEIHPWKSTPVERCGRIAICFRCKMCYRNTPIHIGHSTTALGSMAANHKVYSNSIRAWWRHQMETFSALLAFVRGFHRSMVKSPPKRQ